MMLSEPHYRREELLALGFAAVGEHCLVSRKASFYGVERITLGNNVRIDDFCVLSAGTGGITLGNFIHIAVYTSLIGKSSITVRDFANLSARVSIYASSDDYSGEYMTNPMVDEQFTGVEHQAVVIDRHVIVGAGSVILPGVHLQEGSAVGALSLITKSTKPFMIYAGTPARAMKPRSQALLDKEVQFIKSIT